jgi:hypothetical protein
VVWLSGWVYGEVVKWVPCHRGMTRLRIQCGRDGLHIRREAVTVLNKQLRTVDKG